jgi:hypothetical protein
MLYENLLSILILRPLLRASKVNPFYQAIYRSKLSFIPLIIYIWFAVHEELEYF